MKPVIIIATVLLVMVVSACGSSGGSSGDSSSSSSSGSSSSSSSTSGSSTTGTGTGTTGGSSSTGGTSSTGTSGTTGGSSTSGGTTGGSSVPPNTVDLVFEDYHFHGGQYSTALTFHFRIANHNTAGVSVPAVPWVIRDQNGVTVLSGSTPPLTASSGYDILENYTVPAGRQTFLLVIDPDNTIPETSKANNTAEFITNAPVHELTVVPQANELTWYDAHVHNYGNGNLVFHLMIENLGTNNQPIANVPWEVVRDDGVVVASGTISSLAPGAQAAQNAGIEASFHEAVGEHTYTMIIDPNNTITGDGKADDSVQSIVVVQPSGQA